MRDVEVVGEATDGTEALARIDQLAPDLVLLDIRMPGLDGLAVAARADDLPPIVFTTAYEQHALEAFDVAAVDYLLKPIEPERLRQAIQRARRATGNKLSTLLEQMVQQSSALPRITARHGTSVRVLDPRKLTRFHHRGPIHHCHVRR